MINITFKMNGKSDITIGLPKKHNELIDLIKQYDLEDEQVLIQDILSVEVPELWRLKNKVINLYEFNYFSTLTELLPQGELQKLNAVLYDNGYDKHFDNLTLTCSVLEAYPIKRIKDAICLLKQLDEFELIANNSALSYGLEHIEKMFRDIKRNEFSLDEINELQDLLEPFIFYKQLGESLLEGYELQEVTLGYLKYPKNLCIQENEERSKFDYELSLS